MDFKKLNELMALKSFCNDEMSSCRNEIDALEYIVENRDKMAIKISDETYVGVLESLEIKKLEFKSKKAEMGMLLHQIYLLKSDKL